MDQEVEVDLAEEEGDQVEDHIQEEGGQVAKGLMVVDHMAVQEIKLGEVGVHHDLVVLLTVEELAALVEDQGVLVGQVDTWVALEGSYL